MPVVGSLFQKRVEIRVALHDVRIAKDISVATPEEFSRYQNVPGTLARTVAKEGKLLYDRAA
jgi:hypothetical protein